MIDDVLYILLLIFVLAALFGIFILFFKFMDWTANSIKKEATPPEEKETDTEAGKAEDSEEYPYVKTYLLTKKEWSFYKALKQITDKYHLHILSKVRFADLVQVKNTYKGRKYFKYFSKISSKHIDFVLADPKNLAIKCAIELDDNSHNQIDRQQRDYFIDKVCETVKLPLIHCASIDGVEDQICEKPKIYKK